MDSDWSEGVNYFLITAAVTVVQVYINALNSSFTGPCTDDGFTKG